MSRLSTWLKSPLLIGTAAVALGGASVACAQQDGGLSSSSEMGASGGKGAGRDGRGYVSPYIELDQTFISNLKGGDDGVLTYTTLAAGVDGGVTSRRAEAQISLRYEHQFGWNKRTGDQDIISGMARGRFSVIPDTLHLEAGAIATQVRGDGFTGAVTSVGNVRGANNDIYSFYAGPTLTTHVDDLNVNAAYRFGYTKVQSDRGSSVSGVPRYGAYDDSTFHSLTASVGMNPGAPLPFGWTLSGGYERENASELDQRYTAKWARGDVTVPVSPTLALVGGIGYEHLTISQRPIMIENGLPLVDDRGSYVVDNDAPRQIAYDTDGIIWDAGVLWRPSRRTSLEVRVGRRYNNMNYMGSFNWQASPHSSLSINYFETIDSFGRAMTGNLVGTPYRFNAMRNPTGGLINCVTSTDGQPGQCFNDSLAGITGSNYRSRGVNAQYSWARDRWNWGATLGWTQRKFLAPDDGPLASLDGMSDEYYFAMLYGGVRMDAASGLSANIYSSYMDGAMGSGNTTNYGAFVTYDRSFGRRLMTQATVGIDGVDNNQIDQIISLLARIGVRYTF